MGRKAGGGREGRRWPGGETQPPRISLPGLQLGLGGVRRLWGLAGLRGCRALNQLFSLKRKRYPNPGISWHFRIPCFPSPRSRLVGLAKLTAGSFGSGNKCFAVN